MHATITTKKKNNHCHFTKKTHEIKVNLNHFISYVHGHLVWIYV